MKVMRVVLGLIFVWTLLAVPGLASAQTAGAVSGTLTIRERVALPSNTVVTVQVAEVRSGAPALVIAEQRFTTNGAQPPFRYTVSYDPSRINPNAQYIVQSNMSVDGQIRFTTAQPYRVITGGAPVGNVDMLLVSPGSRLPNTSGGAQPLVLAGLALVAAVTIFAVRRVIVRRNES
ncbi:MAG: YbaY family lipoprotein [Oscillochloridaceae bacterium umkhey_bin13]